MRSLQQWKWGSGNETPSTMEGGLGMRPLQHGQCELQRPRGQGLWWGHTPRSPITQHSVCRAVSQTDTQDLVQFGNAIW